MERHHEVDQILQAALDLAPEDRPKFVSRSCGEDRELQSAVEALLDSFEKAESNSFIETSPLAGNSELLTQVKATRLSGVEIANYRVERQLGAGGMGEVYLARDLRLNRRAALKLLPAHLTTNKERVQRFRQEALTTSALNHPNIITVYDVGTWNGRDYIANEFVDGVSLRERMKESALPAAVVLTIVTQVAKALAAAHDAGVVHRDIKPENIMVRPDGLVKVLDFGIAKYTRAGDSDDQQDTLFKTRPGRVIGTVAYMSPEQVRGLPVDARTDIWSLGVILYEMVARELPFPGATQSDRMAAILEREPAGEFPSNVRPELREIINRTLAKKADRRYQQAGDMAADLQALQHQSGASETIRFSQLASPPRVPFVRRSRAMGTALLIVLSLLAAGAWFLFGRTNPTTQPPKLMASSFQNIRLSRLTTSGRVSQATISPDGNYVVYLKDDAGEQSLWLTHAATDSSREIAPPLTDEYYGSPLFGPDSNYIYFLKGKRGNARASLYRIPLLGGAEKQLLDDISYQDTLSNFSLSPDGKRAAFIRLDERFNRLLVLATLEGSETRTLAARTVPQYLSGAVWSPDGKLVSSFAGTFGARRKIVLFDTETGAESDPFPRGWVQASSMSWLRDSSGLLVAADEGDAIHQLWLMPYPSGDVRRVTNDLSNYRTVSISADSETIIAVQQNEPSAISVVNNLSTGEVSPVTNEVGRTFGKEGLAWISEEKLIYSSREAGGSALWLADASGGEAGKVTAGGDNRFPTVSSDSTTIAFNSTRDNQTPQLWRMNADGSNPVRLAEGHSSDFTPDVKWLVYYGYTAALWKISIAGGEPVQITTGPDLTTVPQVSPDGQYIACNYLVRGPNAQFKLGLVSMEDGKLIRLLEIPTGNAVRPLRWSPDGQAVTYIETIAGVSNIWAQAIDGSPPRRLTNFKSEEIYYFDWSPKGRLLLARGTATADAIRIRDFK